MWSDDTRWWSIRSRDALGGLNRALETAGDCCCCCIRTVPALAFGSVRGLFSLDLKKCSGMTKKAQSVCFSLAKSVLAIK